MLNQMTTVVGFVPDGLLALRAPSDDIAIGFILAKFELADETKRPMVAWDVMKALSGLAAKHPERTAEYIERVGPYCHHLPAALQLIESGLDALRYMPRDAHFPTWQVATAIFEFARKKSLELAHFSPVPLDEVAFSHGIQVVADLEIAGQPDNAYEFELVLSQYQPEGADLAEVLWKKDWAVFPETLVNASPYRFHDAPRSLGHMDLFPGVAGRGFRGSKFLVLPRGGAGHTIGFAVQEAGDPANKAQPEILFIEAALPYNAAQLREYGAQQSRAGHDYRPHYERMIRNAKATFAQDLPPIIDAVTARLEIVHRARQDLEKKTRGLLPAGEFHRQRLACGLNCG